jgi:hypothetical protein
VTRAETEALKALVDLQRGQLLANGIPLLDAPPEWAKRITPQQRAFMGLLIAAFPRAVDPWDVLERLPGLDHVHERDFSGVKAIVYKIRKALGTEAIETIGAGYRLGSLFQSPSGYPPPIP